jgi:hypothetical protein
MKCLKLGSVLLCAPGCCRKLGYHSSTKELWSSNKLNYSVYKITRTILIYNVFIEYLWMTTRCCTLRRAKNTPTRSFVSNLYISEGVPDNSDRDKSARKRGLVGPYAKTTRTINKIDRNHKDTVWHLSTVLGNVKKKSLYNQPKPYFFLKIIVKSFLDRFLQMLHQNIRNCLYFDWLFTHYVVMSDFYLYIIFVFPVCV